MKDKVVKLIKKYPLQMAWIDLSETIEIEMSFVWEMREKGLFGKSRDVFMAGIKIFFLGRLDEVKDFIGYKGEVLNFESLDKSKDGKDKFFSLIKKIEEKCSRIDSKVLVSLNINYDNLGASWDEKIMQKISFKDMIEELGSLISLIREQIRSDGPTFFMNEESPDNLETIMNYLKRLYSRISNPYRKDFLKKIEDYRNFMADLEGL